MSEQKWLTVSEFAARMAVSTASVRAWLRAGRIRGTKIAKVWRIAPDELSRLLESAKLKR